MPDYLLILHESPTGAMEMSPAEIEKIILEYKSWSRSVAEAGKLAGGQKLRDEGGRMLTNTNGDFRVTDGPFAEAKEVIGGFFMIKAADYDEAVEISRTCPHLTYGGRIELREVEPTP